MPKHITKSSESRDEYRFGKHRHEHWRVDNQVYFLTARCRGRFPAFADEDAKTIFWDRFEHHTAAHGFTPWVTSLLDNHYHTLGYLREGKELPIMMQRIHGSIAKQVNDHLRKRGIQPPWFNPPCTDPTQADPAQLYSVQAEGGSPPVTSPVSNPTIPNPTPGGKPPSAKRKPKFFGDRRGHEYFDGCLRSEKQARLTYRYILNQCRRHGICHHPTDYAHTRINIELERAINRANQLDAFLQDVPYPRYQRKHRKP